MGPIAEMDTLHSWGQLSLKIGWVVVTGLRLLVLNPSEQLNILSRELQMHDNSSGLSPDTKWPFQPLSLSWKK